MGLKDEYVDSSKDKSGAQKAPDRATPTSPGVHTDNSIMGNYRTEGAPTAGAKDRHKTELARIISTALGRNFN
jgi:hypothetical protein